MHWRVQSSPSISGACLAEPFIMSELTVGYGQVVLSLFTDLGIKPNILAVVDNIETIKMIVQSEGGIAIVPRACAENEVTLGLLKALSIAPGPQCCVQPVSTARTDVAT